MSNFKAKGEAAGKMDGPVLIGTTATQASAAGGITAYPYAQCFGAKSVLFFVRTAAGVPNISSSTIDIDFGAGVAPVTGTSSGNYTLDYNVVNGTIFVVPGNSQTLFAATNLRMGVDRIAPRIQLAASATGVSCWAVVQWD